MITKPFECYDERRHLLSDQKAMLIAFTASVEITNATTSQGLMERIYQFAGQDPQLAALAYSLVGRTFGPVL